MAQWAKDPVLLQLWCRSQLWIRFSPWSRNFYIYATCMAKKREKNFYFNYICKKREREIAKYLCT